MPKIASLWLLILASQVFHLAGAQPGNLVPVKTDMLDGTRLVLKPAGVSLDVPGAGWKWMTYEGNTGQNFFCSNAGALILVAVGHLHGDFTDHQPQSLIEKAKAAITSRGGKIDADKFEWIDQAGTKKCVRVTFTEHEKDGRKTLVVIYIAQTIDDISLKLQYTGSTATEPDAMKDLLHSLKPLKDQAKAGGK